MREILVAYPSKDTALKLRSLLEGEGYDVPYVCATGASVLSIAQDMSEGVIVCAEGLRDMTAGNIAEHLPPGFDIVAFTRGDTDSFMSNLIYLPLPVDRQEFLNTVGVLVNSVSTPAGRCPPARRRHPAPGLLPADGHRQCRPPQ